MCISAGFGRCSRVGDHRLSRFRVIARCLELTFGMAVMLGALTFGCALAVRTVHLAIEAGAPGWLNLVVLVLAWDAIKFAVMACLISVRCVASAVEGFAFRMVGWSNPVVRGTGRVR